jgi:hypothetical protein
LSAVCTALVAAETNDYRDADVILSFHLPHIEFVSYAGLGGGALFAESSGAPIIETSVGIQFTPAIALGGFFSAAPLSDFNHAHFGVAIADVEAAYTLMSGTELLITPFAAKAIHPVVRVTLGGATVGFLKDIDDEEGYDTATEERFFFASIGTGAEINLSRHLRLMFRGGWRFVANDELVGIGEGALSGPELALTLRTLWRTVID